jgi:beta-glucanase (GH16 family)
LCANEIERIREMKRRFHTYTAYSVGCAIVWAVILAGVLSAADNVTSHKFVMVFAGWVIGWLSATIARAVYPPPKRHAGP